MVQVECLGCDKKWERTTLRIMVLSDVGECGKCGHVFTVEFLVKSAGKKWYNTVYREHQLHKDVEYETSLIPATKDLIPLYDEVETLQKKLDGVERKLQFYLKKHQVNNIYDLLRLDEVEDEARQLMDNHAAVHTEMRRARRKIFQDISAGVWITDSPMKEIPGLMTIAQNELIKTMRIAIRVSEVSTSHVEVSNLTCNLRDCRFDYITGKVTNDKWVSLIKRDYHRLRFWTVMSAVNEDMKNEFTLHYNALVEFQNPAAFFESMETMRLKYNGRIQSELVDRDADEIRVLNVMWEWVSLREMKRTRLC